MHATVGIRELKTNLSRYLGRVKMRREILTVTDRGKVVATINPVNDDIDVDLKIRQLQALGIVSWSGKKLGPPPEAPVNNSEFLASDLLVEDRE